MELLYNSLLKNEIMKLGIRYIVDKDFVVFEKSTIDPDHTDIGSFVSVPLLLLHKSLTN